MLSNLLRDNTGQDIAEYALMLAVLLTVVLLVIQTMGANENSIFSRVASRLASVM
jgi:Flp pilus assembly pilin Flp